MEFKLNELIALGEKQIELQCLILTKLTEIEKALPETVSVSRIENLLKSIGDILATNE